jgi:dTDP-4-amino-4,6-dideoxygalactose transaminase
VKIGSDALAPQGIQRVAVFSFYATKNMTTGEGGMITTADEKLADRMRLFALHGMSKDAWKRYTSAGSWFYEVVVPGYKDNMTDIQAALGIHQLRKLDNFIAVRQQYARQYDQAFADMPEVATPLTHGDRNHIYHLYVLRLRLDRLTIDRAQFIEELKAHNIGASVHFIPVHIHPFYRDTYGYAKGSLPVAERMYEQILSLPLYPRMGEADVEDVVAAVRSIISNHRRS